MAAYTWRREAGTKLTVGPALTLKRARASAHTHTPHTYTLSLARSLTRARAHTQSQAIIKRESDREEELMHQQAALKKALVKAKVSSHTYTDRS